MNHQYLIRRCLVISPLFLTLALWTLVTGADVVGTKTSTEVFHTRECPGAKRIEPENRVTFKTEDEAIASGRRKCKLCERLESEDPGAKSSKPAPKPAQADPPAKTVPPAKQPPAQPEKPRPGHVVDGPTGPGAVTIVEVATGDTLKAATGETIRLLGVSCPELNQPGGAAARKLVQDRVVGRAVDFTVDAAAEKPKDASKRKIGYVKLPRGKDLTLSLIEAGLGWYDRECKCSRTDELVKAEAVARKAKEGVWKPLAGAAGEQKVFVPTEGHSYHEKGCAHLQRSVKPKEMTVNEARAAGYPPCKNWMPLADKKPPATPEKPDKDVQSSPPKPAAPRKKGG